MTHGNRKGSIIPELQNRVRLYDITNQVTNFNFLELVTGCEKKFNVVLKLVTRMF